MTPEKTGACIWIKQYNAWAVCDAFDLPLDIYVFRISGVFHGTAPRAHKHYNVGNVLEWWDAKIEGRVSTMVATNVEYLGYNGVRV